MEEKNNLQTSRGRNKNKRITINNQPPSATLIPVEA